MAGAKMSTYLQDQVSPTSPASPQTLSSEAVLDALKMILIDAPLNEVLTSVTRLKPDESLPVGRARTAVGTF